ncbi:hypothetical protein [Leptospira alstonii]|uniref:hypothetical protein n=1 Tax=Leptospira alstonii TaxID=28452 RepID=UPI0012E73FD5|nr:hypothetical protein [Leptospira alstonii]
MAAGVAPITDPHKLKGILEEEGSKTHVSSGEWLGIRILHTIKRKRFDRNEAFYLQKV